MITWRLVPSHSVQLALILEAFVDQGPHAILIRVYLAFAIVGAPARTIDQPLVTTGHGTQPPGISQDAISALGTDLLKEAHPSLLPDKEGIQGGNDRDLELTVNGLHPEGAGHDEEGFNRRQ